MVENLALWEQLNRPPASALKTIQGGRLRGMSDINPQWRYLALTEQLGPCGIGWKFTIDKLWLEPGSEGGVFAFAQIELCILNSGVWSEPIPGIGGSKLIQNEQSGLYDNDEAYKMAVTDALSTACKMLGVAADIYMGLWDGSKYRDNTIEPNREKRIDNAAKPQEEENPFGEGAISDYPNVTLPSSGTKGINDAKAILALAQKEGWSEADFIAWQTSIVNKPFSEINVAQAALLLNKIKEIAKEGGAS